jgi:hypothetical protein
MQKEQPQPSGISEPNDDAIFDTNENGHPNEIGGLADARRRDQFEGRVGTLSIRVGQGQVNLSLPFARPPAAVFDPGGDCERSGDQAAH